MQNGGRGGAARREPHAPPPAPRAATAARGPTLRGGRGAWARGEASEDLLDRSCGKACCARMRVARSNCGDSKLN